MLQLRGEVTRLRQQAAQFDELVRINQDLRNNLDEIVRRGLPMQQAPGAPEDKEKADSIQCCLNNLKQFGFAIRIWSSDNQRQESNFSSANDELPEHSEHSSPVRVTLENWMP